MGLDGGDPGHVGSLAPVRRIARLRHQVLAGKKNPSTVPE
jgi:hypothetical protein